MDHFYLAAMWLINDTLEYVHIPSVGIESGDVQHIAENNNNTHVDEVSTQLRSAKIAE